MLAPKTARPAESIEALPKVLYWTPGIPGTVPPVRATTRNPLAWVAFAIKKKHKRRGINEGFILSQIKDATFVRKPLICHPLSRLKWPSSTTILADRGTAVVSAV
jgi:hypothetical protein